jgi:hypothetical protein
MTTTTAIHEEIGAAIDGLRLLLTEYVQDNEGETKRQRFARLFAWRKALEEIVGTDDTHGLIRDEANRLGEALLEEFVEDGTKDWRSNIGVTVYVETRLWASTRQDSTAEQAVAALKASGYDYLVAERFNMQTLSARARELAEAGETFPPEVLAHIEVKPKITVRARRGS